MHKVWPIRNGFICCFKKQSLSIISSKGYLIIIYFYDFDKERCKKFSFNVLELKVVQNLDFGHSKTLTERFSPSAGYQQYKLETRRV